MAIFENFRGFEHLYDAQVRTKDGYEFPVHRVLLAMKSKYFNKLMQDAPTEQREFFVSEIKGAILEVILEYIYTGKLNFTEANITDILLAANILGIEDLLNISRRSAIANLNITNSIPLFIEGIKDEKLGILKASLRFIEVNFEKIVRYNSSSFQGLTVKSLKKILSSDSLNISSEFPVWTAIVSWINAFPENRKKYLKTLIPCIRFGEANSDLVQEMLNHPFIKEESSNIDLIGLPNSLSIVPGQRLPKKLYFFTKSFISRSDYAKGIEIYITYDDNIDVWRCIASKMFRPDVILHGSGRFVVMLKTIENIIYTFDILSKTWSSLYPTILPRWKYSLVVLGNYIYVIGGFCRNAEIGQIVTALERYNFNSESWEFAASHDKVIDGAAAVAGNKIFLFGIPDFYSEVLSAQVYDPDTDAWRTITPPKVYRRHFALVVYQEQLFVIGGRNHEEYLTTVEVYDTCNDIWKDFENLPFSYILPKAVTINDVLYVYDNHSDETRNFRRPTVLWDEINLKWKVVEASSPFCNLYIYQFCTIEDSTVIMEMRKENRDSGTRWVESPFFAHLNS